MKIATPKRNPKSTIPHGLQTPPLSPTAAKESNLRTHLQNLLDNLPQDLPSYYHEKLLEELDFLLHSPLFLYAITPRLRQRHRCHQKRHPQKPNLDIQRLRMEIKWKQDSWVTCLLYDTKMLIEGREHGTTQEAGFIPSFRFFCEEVEFLYREFWAREGLASTSCDGGMGKNVSSMHAGEMGDGHRLKKMRRLVKLKVRYRVAGDRQLRVRKQRKY